MKKKQNITLLEVMIVIFIVGIIGSVLGFNMKGSMESGRAFKTKEGARKIHEILQIEPLEGETDNLFEEVQKALKRSGLVSNVKDLMTDGWGVFYQDFRIEGGELRFSSKNYENFCEKKGKQIEYPWEENELSL